MIEVMKLMVTSFKRSHAALLHSVPPTLQQAIIDPSLTHIGHLKTPHTLQITRATEKKYKVTILKECHIMERKKSKKSEEETTLPFTPGIILRPNTLNCF